MKQIARGFLLPHSPVAEHGKNCALDPKNGDLMPGYVTCMIGVFGGVLQVINVGAYVIFHSLQHGKHNNKS